MDLRLDTPLPRELAVGAGTALAVCGTCFDTGGAIRRLSLVVDGNQAPLSAFGMPRLDLFRELHPGLDPFSTDHLGHDPGSAHDPDFTGYRSGFWGLATVRPSGRGKVKLELAAELEGGAQRRQALGEIRVWEPTPAPATTEPDPAAGPLIAICMATYEAPRALLGRQLASIRAQSYGNWVCVISDDCSSAEGWATVQELVGDDPRFVVSRSWRRLGFYRNFERAFGMAPANARLIAPADQDDIWRPDKLARLLSTMGDASLAFSDARVVSEGGKVLSETYFTRRTHNFNDFYSLLITNSVTGAAALIRREVLDLALPFPPAQFSHYHDHWLAVVAAAVGRIAYEPEPLYDYVQHGSAVVGHEGANRMPTLRQRLPRLIKDPRERVRLWRLHYFSDLFRLQQFAQILDLRCRAQMDAPRRAALDRFRAADRSWPELARMWARGGRELVGESRTLGGEWMLAYALTWRRLLTATTTDRPRTRLRLDAVPPGELISTPSMRPAEPRARVLSERVAPLELGVAPSEPRRLNVLISAERFTGDGAEIALAMRLSERGRQVRLVSVDGAFAGERHWHSLAGLAGLQGSLAGLELVSGREIGGLPVSPQDSFVATGWPTAHIAAAACAELERPGFVYLIREHAPSRLPAGSASALAQEALRVKHFALFSSPTLERWFLRHRQGVFADAEGQERSAAFQIPIQRGFEPRAAPGRRLLLWARPDRPETMLELALLALGRAVAQGALAGWELGATGTRTGSGRIELGGGAGLRVLDGLEDPVGGHGSESSDGPGSAVPGPSERAALMHRHDVGLALHLGPDPALVAVEMAAAGLVTVTNTSPGTSSEELAEISGNMVAAEPRLDALTAAIVRAGRTAKDLDARRAGAQIRWTRSWTEALNDALLERVMAALHD